MRKNKNIPVRAVKTENGFLFDFGKAAFAQLEIELCGEGGEIVDIWVGEIVRSNDLTMSREGSVASKKMTLVLQRGKHTYSVALPAHVRKEYTPDYNCKPPQECQGEIYPFRYAQICGYRGKVTIYQIAYFDDFDDQSSYFKSSSIELNRIWDFCKYTVKATNIFGVYIDGERERLPYEGDTYVNQLSHFCCDNNYKIAKNTIDYLFRHPTWPTEWRLLMPVIVYDYLLYSGDTMPFQNYWKGRLTDFFDNGLIGTEGFLKANTELKDIVDWPAYERDEYEFGSNNFVPNSYLYHALLIMYHLTNEAKYLQRATQVKKLLREKMFDGKLFFDSDKSKHSSLHSLLFSIRFGIAEKSEIPFIMENIKKKGMACGVYGAQFLLETLYREKEADYAFDLMINNTTRGWLHMLKSGATITMESWDSLSFPSRDWSHSWATAPANIIPRYLMGIRPLEFGFKTFVIDPQVCKLEYAKIRHPTIWGPIKMEVAGREIKIDIPENCLALYHGKFVKSGIIKKEGRKHNISCLC